MAIGGTSSAQVAQDLVANLNAAVPEAGFDSGLVVFGKGAGTCMGDGVARQVYGITEHVTADFQKALESIGCVRSTTPIADAVDVTSEALEEDTGDLAVFIVSDFRWSDGDAVLEGLDALRKAHPGQVCVHAVRVGNAEIDADIVSQVGSGDCGSAMSAGDLLGTGAMTTYVASKLMAPLEYERHSLSARTLFNFDSDMLKESGKAELRKLGEYIRSKGMRVSDIDIIGHTDSIGSEAYNLELSKRRARAVQAFLVENGVREDIIDVSGMGKMDPVASNDTEEGRALNRRVEVLVGTASPAKQ